MTTLIPTTQAGELALHFYPDAASRNRVTDGVRQPPNGTRLVAARHSSLGGARNVVKFSNSEVLRVQPSTTMVCPCHYLVVV
jgi:hypothetical protein